MRLIDLTCPGCGSAAQSTTKECERCGRPIILTSFSDLQHLDVAALRSHAKVYSDGLRSDPNDVPVNASLGICYLKLGLYDEAARHLRVASDHDPTDSELFFYAAIGALGGKRPFIAGLQLVRNAGDLLEAAIRLERRPTYLLTRGYICQDYFRRKYLKPPSDDGLNLAEARTLGLSDADMIALSEMLGAGFIEFCSANSPHLPVV